MAKKAWESKTIWINIIAIVIAILASGLLGMNPTLEISLLGLVNIVLRFSTKQPILLR